jgi:toxin-antitoxin system PIN domain toxin
VNLVDANVLIYAVNSDDDHNDSARAFLDRELSSGGGIAFAWISLLAFLRLTTHPTVFASPLAPDDAVDIARGWLDSPNAVLVQETPRHLEVLAELLVHSGTGGNLTSDAHLAALALEHRATVRTYDSDFGRFPGVRWAPPD